MAVARQLQSVSAVDLPELRGDLSSILPYPGAADNEVRIQKLEVALRADHTEIFAPAEAALELLADYPACPELSSCWLNLARWHFMNDRLAKAFGCASASLSIARALGRPDLRAKALNFQAMYLSVDGQDAAAMRLMVQALADAKLASSTHYIASILTNIGCILMDAGYYAGACQGFKHAIDAMPLPATWGCLSQVFLDLGEIASGFDAARRGLAIVNALDMADRFTQVGLEVSMTQLSIASGDLLQAAIHADAAQSVALTVGQTAQRQARLNALSLDAHEPSKADETLCKLMLEMKSIDDFEFDRSDRSIIARAFCTLRRPDESLKLLSDIERRRLSSRASPNDYLLPHEISAGTSTSLDAQVDAFLKLSQTNALYQSIRLSSIPQQHVEHLVRLAIREEMRESPAADDAHVFRVSRLAQLLAREAGCNEDAIRVARLAGLLHDVGKVCVPDQMLCKAGPLTEDEMTLVKAHAQAGAELIATLRDDSLPGVAQAVRHSHERWDGAGYPAALRADDIPLAARIVALADSFDAITHARHFRPARDFESAVAELERGSGTLYDPRLISMFAAMVRRLRNTTHDLDHVLAEGGALFFHGPEGGLNYPSRKSASLYRASHGEDR